MKYGREVNNGRLLAPILLVTFNWNGAQWNYNILFLFLLRMKWTDYMKLFPSAKTHRWNISHEDEAEG